MTRKMIFLLVILVLLSAVGVTTISAQGKTQPINMTLSGSIMTIDEGVGLFDVNLQGSPGSANARGLSFSYPVGYSDLPAGNPCIDLPSPLDAVIITTDAQITITFKDGSMLFGNATEGGYVCFAPGFAYAPYELVGGTGRFEDATGYIDFNIDAHRFGGPGAPVTAETGAGIGEIVLP